LFPSPGADQWFPVSIINVANQIEICRCTTRTADTLTVVRGQEGTPARSLGIGEKVEHRLTAGALSELRDRAITAAQIPNQLITGPMIAADAITSGKIKDGNVGTPELFDASVTAAKLAAGVAQANLGYRPVHQGGGINQQTNEVLIGWTNLNKLGVTIDVTDIGWLLTEHPSGRPDSGGYRGMPISIQDGNYTILPSDCGKMIQHRSGANTCYWVIPSTTTAAWTDGGAIIKLIALSGPVIVQPASGVTLVSMRDLSTGNRTLAAGTSATLEQIGANYWFIHGSAGMT
jgi:hypothetical protein